MTLLTDEANADAISEALLGSATVVAVFFFAMVVAGGLVAGVVVVVSGATIEVVVVVVITVVDAVVKLVVVATAIVVSWTDCVEPHAGNSVRATPSVKQIEARRINLDSSQGCEVVCRNSNGYECEPDVARGLDLSHVPNVPACLSLARARALTPELRLQTR